MWSVFRSLIVNGGLAGAAASGEGVSKVRMLDGQGRCGAPSNAAGLIVEL
jgi:hypothetical protein